jgi:hypothetical protein
MTNLERLPTNAETGMEAGPLFIAGMWRGGSSLLHILLNKHPQVALTFEADLVLLRPAFLKPDYLSDWADRWECWNRMFSRHGLNPGEFAEVRPEFKSVFAAVHRAYARRKRAAIWGDKSPNYHDQLLAMAKAFPSARFIIVWRDPIDTIGATLRAAASGSRYFSKRGMPWRSLLGYGIFKRECAKLIASGAAVHQLRYEDLVSDTATVMRRVCDFLRIPYDDSLCTLEGADRSAVYAGRHHDLLKKNAIVCGPRHNFLDPKLRRRAEHYVRIWQQFDAQGVAPRQVEKPVTAFPGAAGAPLDHIRCLFYRVIDSLIRVGFCFLPLPLLRAYRQVKERSEEPKFSECSTEFGVTNRDHA